MECMAILMACTITFTIIFLIMDLTGVSGTVALLSPRDNLGKGVQGVYEESQEAKVE